MNAVVTINGLVVTINGRKALPIRALCLLAGRKRLSPDVVAGAACGEDHYDGDRHLPTYQLVDGVVHAVDPTHWVLFCEAIESASLLLIGKGPSLRATRTQWFNEATMLLPGGVFVWLDEFQNWFRRTRPYRVKEGKTGLQLEQPEEGRVSLAPPISDELRACLLAGFSPTPALPTAPTPEQPAPADAEPASNAGTIPGKLPKVSVGKLAVKAAWELELETVRLANVPEVMKRLQSWADEGKEPEYLISSDRKGRCVMWRTKDGSIKPYGEDACSKTIRAWINSRH